MPYNAFGLIDGDQPVLCADRVRFAGDKVAVVVAETNDAAEAAARLVTVVYEDLPAVTDPRAALAPDAQLVHETRGSNVESKEDALIMCANEVDTTDYAERLDVLSAALPGPTIVEQLDR